MGTSHCRRVCLLSCYLKFLLRILTFLCFSAGGMVAACLTSPLDVLKTRLQSEPGRQCRNAPVSKVFLSFRFLIFHFHRTGHDLSSIRRVEGWRALFRGLGPTLSGIVPASAIKFYAYGTSKALISKYMNGGKESAWVHLYAAATAGLSVSTATNPIWVVKTRLQLDRAAAESSTKPALPRYKNSLDCALQVMRQEGIRGFYRGLTASYLGVTESTIQWVLYEQMKFHIARRGLQRAFGGQEDSLWFDVQQWVQKFSAAAGSKLIATGITYPHEVRSYLFRQPS